MPTERELTTNVPREQDGLRKYQRIESWIREGIVANRFLPGEKIPSESELRRRFDVSRNAVRQAIRNLIADGYLESYKGVGTFCRARPAGQALSTNIGYVTFFTGAYIFPEVIRGCDHVLYRKGFHLFLNQSEYDRAKERSILNNLRKKGVDGIIISPVYSSKDPGANNVDLLREIRAEGIAVVLCDNTVPDSDFCSVVLDDAGGGELAARYLWERGHRRIGIFFQGDYEAKRNRMRGAARYLEAQGKPVPRECLIEFSGQGMASTAPQAAQRGLAAMRELPTAMICSSDEDALHLIKAAEGRGLRIPRDLSIIGFDNSSVAQLGRVSLTTVQHPSFYFGEAATTMLLDQIFHPELRIVERRVVGPALVERTSVAEIA